MASGLRAHENTTVSKMLTTVAAEVLMVCAVLLLLFVYLDLPITLATGAALFALLLGSLFCWSNLASAQIILLLSLFSVEFVLLSYFGMLLIPFVILDILVIAIIAKTWNPKEE